VKWNLRLRRRATRPRRFLLTSSARFRRALSS
jgi:hypothetical protein